MRDLPEDNRVEVEARLQGLNHWTHDDQVALQGCGFIVEFTPETVLIGSVKDPREGVESILSHWQDCHEIYPYSKIIRMIALRKLRSASFEVRPWFSRRFV